MLSDNQQAREMQSNGIYIRVPDGDIVRNAQEYFFEQAYAQKQETVKPTDASQIQGA